MGNAWMKGERNQDLQTKRRLALMRLIREENHLNQQRIRNREEILYGKSDSYGYMLDGYEQEEPDAVYDGYGGYKPPTAAERERQAGGVQLSTFGSPISGGFAFRCVFLWKDTRCERRRHSDGTSGKFGGGTGRAAAGTVGKHIESNILSSE